MQQRLFLLLAGLVAACWLPAQKINTEPFKAMSARNIGPAGMSGRVTAIDAVWNDPDVIYLGTASGGIWKSTSGGVRWEPVFDKQPVQAIGAIAVNQRNPSEVWAGTGEGNPRNSQNSGEGIYKSPDAGFSWKYMGLKETKTIHRIIIHRDNPDVVFAAALGSAWGPSDDRGVYKTTDGGKTWRKVLFVNNQTGCADLVTDPSNPNKLIAAMWEYGRKPWTFNSGGKGSGLYVSLDGGETWERRTDKDGLPKGDLGRIGLAVSRSKPDIVYALVEAKENALYRSDDGGRKWRKMADRNMGDRPFYYAEIYVDPKNENRVYSIHTVITRSEDGGRTFDNFAGWTIHPDHHAFWIHPDNPDYIINGNDGGANITRDGGKTWRFVENLPVGQFYHVNVDNEVPYNVYGGLQDNGSWAGPSSVWRAGGIRNHDWQEVLFGDGFDVLPKRNDSRFGFAMSQGGNLNTYDRKTGKTAYIRPVIADTTELRFNWNAALAQNPFHDCGIYYGSQFVHKSMDCGKSWTTISPDLTTNDTTKQKQGSSGGLTPDVTAAENHCTILCIAPSPADEQLIWAGTDDGNLQLTRDGGKTWENLSARLPDCPKNAWIPQIEVSAKNPAEAYVVVNHYRMNDWRPFLYKTTDYGKTWKRIADEKKVSGHCLSVVQDPEAPNLLFLGTDYGLWFTIDGGDTWNKWTVGDFPSVSVSDLKIHPREHDLVISTFGRSFWIIDDIRPLREIARTGGAVLNKNFRVFPAPDAWLATNRSYEGVHFTADSYFSGRSRSTNAMFTIWVKKVEKAPAADKEKAEADKKEVRREDRRGGGRRDDEKKKATIRIFDASGDSIRTYSVELDTGINRVYWGLERKGVRFPNAWEQQRPEGQGQGRMGRQNRDDEPGGMRVEPGTYKVVISYGDDRDTTMVTVRPDPRLPESAADQQARFRATTAFYKWVEKATQAVERLKDTEKTMKLVDDQLDNVPDSLKKDVTKMAKAMRDTIAELKKFCSGPNPDGQKGITRSVVSVNSSIFEAMGRLGDSDAQPGNSVSITVDKAKSQITQLVSRVNRFLERDWADYQQKVEAIRYSLFKKLEPVKLD